MTLEEFVVAVHRHRQLVALLACEWGGAIDDEPTRQLVGMLVASDRELGHLCRQLSLHIGRLDDQQTIGRTNGQEGRSKWT